MLIVKSSNIKCIMIYMDNDSRLIDHESNKLSMH